MGLDARLAAPRVDRGRSWHDATQSDPFAGYLGFAAAIGRRLAEVHAALARPSDDPAFAPEQATKQDGAAWAAAAAEGLERAFELLAHREGAADEQTDALVKTVTEQRKPLLAALRRIGAAGGAVLKTRVHGDFHLGQVLVAEGDAVIVDFEGEPARSLDERRAKTSPMKDVAGLLRSFDYAAAALPLEGGAEPSAERRRALLEKWQHAATSAFLNAYRAVAAEQPNPWIRTEGEQDVMDLFLIDKVAYEIAYEAANRPAWLPIPLRGLASIAQRLLA